MKLPAIKFGANQIKGAFGRHDIGIPGRNFAAKSAEINALTNIVAVAEKPVVEALLEQKNRNDLMQLDDADFEFTTNKNDFDKAFAGDAVDSSTLTAQDVPGVALTKTVGGKTVSRGSVPTSEFWPALRFKKINKRIDEIAPTMKNERTRAEWVRKHKLQNENDLSDMTIAATKVQKKQRADRQISQLKELETREDFTGQRELIGNMEISDEEKSQLRSIVSQQEEVSNVTGVLLSGSDFEKAQTEKALRSNDYKGNLTKKQRVSLANSLKNNIKTSSVKTDNLSLTSISGRIKEYQIGSENDLSPVEANVIVDQAKRQRAKDMINAAIDGREVMDDLYAGNFESANTKLNALNDKAIDPGSPDRDIQALNNGQAAFTAYAREWEADPVQTILKRDKTAKAMQDKMPQGKDRQQAEGVLRNYLRAAQERRGVQNPSLLTETKAKTLGAQISSLQGQDYVINLNQVKGYYGDDWIDVQRQLRDNKSLSGVQAVLGDMPMDSLAAADLATAATQSKEIWETLNLPKGGGTDANKAVQAALGPLGQTIRLSSEGENTVYSDYAESITALAGLWLSQGRVSSIEDGIEKAANELVLDQYHEIDDTYRVPVQFPETVKSRLDTFKSTPQMIGFDPLPDYAGMDNAEELTLAAFRSGGYFVNNGNDTGVVPMLDGGIPLTKDGSILDLSFEELSIQAPRRETPMEKRRRRK